MDHLYAPWRNSYVTDSKVKDECVFCSIAKAPENDSHSKVLHRAKHCFLVMNRFPYTPGHFLILPYEHIADLEQLDLLVWQEMMSLAHKGVSALKLALNARGINMGINLGAAAGAGIAEHLHYHLLPRWERDTNFITTVGENRVYSSDFTEEFIRLKGYFDKDE